MAKNTNTNLLLINDSILYERDKMYFSKSDTFLQFIWYLKEHFNHVTIYSPVLKTNSKPESLFKVPLDETGKIEIRETFPYKTVIDYYIKLPLIYLYNLPIFINAVKKADTILLITNGMNSFLVAFLAFLYKKPLFSYFVGDQRSIVEKGSKYTGITLKLALMIANLHVFLYKKIISFSKACFFISSDLKEKLGKYNANSFLVVASLVDDSDISISNNSHKLNNSINLLFVGRLSHEKGIEYLIKSVQHLAKEKFELHLLICGDGPERERLEILVEKMGLSDFVSFYGFIPWGKELSKFYSESDIFVLPSVSEGVPKVLLEAMANGVAIIATNVGGIPDIINNMENGVLVTPKSPEAIENAVKKIVENNDIRKKLIQNGYSFIREHTAQKQVKKLAELMYKHLG